jgi:HD-like signal output (HDOD) protein
MSAKDKGDLKNHLIDMKDTAAEFNALIDPSLRQRIEAIDSLPTLPEIYNQLMSELSSSEVAMNRVAAIVARDVAISAKLLQVVNSAYFGVATEIKGVQQAVNYLGVDTVKGIVLSAGVYSGTTKTDIVGFSPADLYRRGVAVGSKARFIAFSFGLGRSQIDNALTAGLLHDVGKLVLLTGFAEELKAAIVRSGEAAVPLHLAEEEVIGASDAAIGGYLLGTWGLSESIIEAVSLHYQPSRATRKELNPTAAVHLAYASESDNEHRIEDLERSAFDLTYTDELGITGQLSSLRGLTAEAVAQSGLAP